MWNADDLQRFCGLFEQITLTFYGGEPLLNLDLILEIMAKVQHARYMLQTNGMFLSSLPRDALLRFHTILVSVDGTPATTDRSRGRGAYARIIRNVEHICSAGFTGDVMARMTAWEATDIEKDVRWLCQNCSSLFSSFHWQLNALLGPEHDDWHSFDAWARDIYCPGLRRLASWWVREIEDRGTVIRIMPFLGVMSSILNETKVPGIRCGAGEHFFNIFTDGTIGSCPVFRGMKDHVLGSIFNPSEDFLCKAELIGPPCTQCNIFEWCGGRCLYANKTKEWGEGGFKSVCRTVRALVDAMMRISNRVSRVLQGGAISPTAFEYTQYNGCEVIP